MEKIKIWLEKYFKEIIFSFSIIIILLTFISYCFNHSFGIGNNYELNTDKLGSFGDFVGGFLGTILTIIATIYIYQTFNAQKKSIEIQEDQLKNQKEELKSQKTELILQRQLIAQQQFESSFFNMINVHRELKNGLKLDKENNLFYGGLIYPNSDKSGVEVISKISNDFEQFYKSDFIFNTLISENNLNYLITKILTDEYDKNNNLFKELEDPDNPTQLLVEIDEFNWDENNNSIEYQKKKIYFFFKYLFKNYQNQISHYCRNVYHILKYIRENEKNETLGKDSKKYKNYANIFQSQLNVDEQFLLFYNFIHFDKETEDEIFWTINLVNHYKFLENIGIENLILKKHEEFYDFVIKGSDRKIVKK